MALKNTEFHLALPASCHELRGGMNATRGSRDGKLEAKVNEHLRKMGIEAELAGDGR
ncbi:hypothetical protein [Novipirellula rosea]